MYRIFRHYVPKTLLMLGAAECLILLVSVYLGVTIRFLNWDDAGALYVQPLFPRAAAFTLVMIAVMMAMGLYQRDYRDGPRTILLRLLLSFFIGLTVMGVIHRVVPMLFLDGGTFGMALLASFIGISSCRFLCYTRTANRFCRRVLVLGAGERANQIRNLRRSTDRSGVEIVGYVPIGHDRPRVDERIYDVRTSLEDLVDDLEIDELVIAVDDRRKSIPVDAILQCKMRGVQVIDDTTYYERQLGKIRLDALNPSHVIFSDGFTQAVVRVGSKRVFDILVSLFMLVPTLPLMVGVAIAILVEDGWRAPIIYRQKRVGRDGRAFQVLKFRSMRTDAESDGKAQWARSNDQRITRVGAFIRKVRLDELPQLWNVLKGDMSFVGPRPERPEFVAELAQRLPYYNLRHHVKPGITGWAQVCFPYGASIEDAREKLEYDLYYLKNYSVFLDLTILLQTVQVVLWGKGSR